MKTTVLAVVAGAASMAMAQPHAHLHKHRHAHQVKREVTVTSSVPGPTTYAYVLDGNPISLEQVCQGLDSNELKFADGNGPADLCSQLSSSSSSSSSNWAAITTSASSAAATAGQFYNQNTTSTSTTSASSSSSVASSSSEWSSVPSAPSVSSGQGVTSEFPDGTLDCSTFPSNYGAVSLDYLGLGGWSGLQAVTIVGSAVTNIVTGVSGQSCTEGMMCSYACPPGYQKSQWPPQQGASGQSVGGIQCKNGKLYLTNPTLSKSLCMPGVGGVSAQNKASSVVSICRTDYPGTESETIPVELQAGETQELACPDAANYYSWQQKSTSAQYYLNPIGTAASVGCQWGSPGNDVGNYAPMNFGVGAKDGKTWLSLFQNAPTTNTKYQGTVEITGSLSGTCKYSNGQYCGAAGCNDQGCTVAVISGEATFVISS